MGIFNRRSLTEIKRDNTRLRNEDRHENERDKASKENFNLKHANKVRMVKNVGKGVSWVGRGVGAGITALGNQYAKAEASKQPPKRKRRVKKVKKKKKNNNNFTLTYN